MNTTRGLAYICLMRCLLVQVGVAFRCYARKKVTQRRPGRRRLTTVRIRWEASAAWSRRANALAIESYGVGYTLLEHAPRLQQIGRW